MISNRCPDGESIDWIAYAMERLADSLDGLKPAAAVVHDLAERLDKQRLFVRRKGPWILASIPASPTAVGAITSELAAQLKRTIAALSGLG